MTKLTITGSKRPIVGNAEAYSLSVFDNLLTSNSFSFPSPKVQWSIHVQDSKGWRIARGNIKEGNPVIYTFTNKSLKYKAIKIEAVRGNDKGALYIHPKEAEEPRIISVELLDVYSRRLPKGKLLHYTDTVIAQANCVGMLGQKIAFTLWEDDAIGKGHDPVVNMMNKINQIPLMGEVDDEGIARVVFRLSAYTMAVQIANARVAKGDQEEGQTHEYYATAEVMAKYMLKASPNIPVANPEYVPHPKKIPDAGTGKRKGKPSPLKETAKFPQTSAAKKQADPEGKILSAVFTDNTGRPLKNARTGDKVAIKITAQHMRGKNVTVRIWEEDLWRYSHDLLYEESITLPYDVNFINTILLTREMYNKSHDFGEGKDREYFIEVEHLNTSVTSQVIPVSPDAKPMKVEANNSPVMIKEQKQQVKNCGGQYCIDKNSAPNELIREINIRLAGFGGNVPTDRFTDRTEKMIKQFQRDYMKVPETGKVCGHVLRAIDEFCRNFEISITLWNQLKCSCSTKGKRVTSALRGTLETNNCKGFGDGTGKNTYKGNVRTEAMNKYEYPGLHRSLLYGFKALQFYFSQQKTYTIDHFTSGYRCRFKNYTTTNHQGKAIDIQFSKGNWAIRGGNKENLAELRMIRDSIFIKYLGAQKEWPGKNLFSIEPIDLRYSNKGKLRYDHTFSWIHMDVRQFDSQYLEDQYFCKSLSDLNEKSIVQLATELGFANTCSCYGAYQSQHNKSERHHPNTCEDRFKKIAPIILKHEGGYKNEPSKDKGDPTNRGISWPVWQKYAKEDLGIEPTEENQKKLTEEQATVIYRKRYWEPNGYCEINNLKVALMVYDWSITSGGAIREVQKLLVNEFNQTLTIDGGMGKETANALNQPKDQEQLLTRISEIRKEYYDYGASQNWFSADYLKGLKRRVDQCRHYTL
ncbi:glycosyl hydrolase 108 family protein [Chryseobacterium pennipullorum]|nr:glycosyl hydrolase 108 family protein [Chryseobacterium pennipullorum]